MSDNNQFQPYRYHQQPHPEPGRPSLNISASRQPRAMPSSGIGALLRRPLVATAALLVTAGIFAAVIMISYPDSKEPMQNAPVIRADVSDVRRAPDDPGGMRIANADSTIFQQMRSSELGEKPPVENLLDVEQPASKDEVFATEAKAILEETPTRIEKSDDSGEIQADDTSASSAPVMAEAEPPPAPLADVNPAVEPPSQSGGLHAPASSPETLAFVRSVLDQKDATVSASAENEAEAEKAAAVQPAAGVSGIASAIQPSGTYFVQLASITSEAAAAKEWSKIKSAYSAQLSQAEYRVNRADLGEKGIYYRIQAGPYSKDRANAICDAIKAQKPGGCLVVR